MDKDLFGDPIEKDVLLREKFIEPPFSVLDTKQGSWQARKKMWKNLGLQSEVGRNVTGKNTLNDLKNNPRKAESAKKIMDTGETVSIFDPALCEVLYHWFCPKGGTILDTFAGGSVRGVVAQYMGYKYTGLELRDIQVKSNVEQCLQILKPDNQPLYITGDSDKSLDNLIGQFDLLFTCPPYADLEIYSDDPDDISNMDYPHFLSKYTSIIKKSITLLKKGQYAVIVVGEVRDKEGFYRDFVGDTKRAFIKNGAKLYNDAVLLNSVGTATLRTRQFDASKKLVKIHQNVLVFKKV